MRVKKILATAKTVVLCNDFVPWAGQALNIFLNMSRTKIENNTWWVKKTGYMGVYIINPLRISVEF